MDAADDISREFWARTRPGRLSPQMEITGEGIVFGPATILAGMEKDGRGRPRLVVDERRAAAILSTAFEQGIDPLFLARLRRAAGLWNEGEAALAQLHLIFADAPACDDPDLVLRLFVAEEMLKAGVGPDILLKAQGVDPGLFAEAGAPLVKAAYNPDQPRDAHGRWSGGGAEAEPAAYRGKGRLKAIGRFLEWLGSRARRFERESEETKHPEPLRPETRPEPVQPGNRPEVSKPDYPLPRPGRGEPVDIPGLPLEIKGIDNTNDGAKAADYSVELTRREFESQLLKQGWTPVPTQDGKAMNYSSTEGARYSIRDFSKSTGGATAEYFHPQSNIKDANMKLRLRNE
ncbi:hypothetical protein [Methylocella tundrae]|uniref:hypothetical protein n=1 Tax=Methylocella tundrae TaxID=227605 RepID=UPI00106BB6EE|nr:hypothetical protein [Methylocella tundrae]